MVRGELDILKKSEVVVVMPVCARDGQKLLRTLEIYSKQNYNRPNPFSVVVLLNGKDEDEGNLQKIKNGINSLKSNFSEKGIATLNIIPVVCSFPREKSEFAKTNIAHLREMGTMLVAIARHVDSLKTMIVSHDADLAEYPYGREPIASKYMQTIAEIAEKENPPLLAGADKFSLTNNDRMNFVIMLSRYWNNAGDLKTTHQEHREKNPKNKSTVTVINRKVYPEEHNSAYPLEGFLRGGGYTPDELDLSQGIAESGLLRRNMGIAVNGGNHYAPPVWLTTDSRRIQTTAMELGGVFPDHKDIWGDWGNDGSSKRNSRHEIPDLAIGTDENFSGFAKNIANSMFFKRIIDENYETEFMRVIYFLVEMLLRKQNSQEAREAIYTEHLRDLETGFADILGGALCVPSFNSGDNFMKFLVELIEQRQDFSSYTQGMTEDEIEDFALNFVYDKNRNIEAIKSAIMEKLKNKLANNLSKNAFDPDTDLNNLTGSEISKNGIVEDINCEKFSRLMNYRRKVQARNIPKPSPTYTRNLSQV